MGVLSSAIERRVHSTVEAWLDERIPGIFNDIMRKEATRRIKLVGKLNPTQFVWQMAFEFMRHDLSIVATDARDLAINTLKDFMRGERIKFGHCDYTWDQDAAFTLAREWEIDNWEHPQ